jgi:hypothetical protein
LNLHDRENHTRHLLLRELERQHPVADLALGVEEAPDAACDEDVGFGHEVGHVFEFHLLLEDCQLLNLRRDGFLMLQGALHEGSGESEEAFHLTVEEPVLGM